MRIAWYSNPPHSASGYGVQTKQFALRLKALGHDVAVISNCGLQYGALNYGGVHVYPCSHRGSDPAQVRHQVKDWNADFVLSFFDAWALNKEFFAAPWVPWFPVDREGPLPNNLRQAIDGAAYRVACTRFGQRAAESAGLQCDYVPCAVDTKVFDIQDRAAARAEIGIPNDVFLFGIVADNKSNPSRKALQQQVHAFAEFAKSHPDARLMMHTCMDESRGGIPLAAMVEYLGIKDRVLCTDQMQYHAGLPEAFMVSLYNACDALLAVSMDEGFGVPIVEAQACGTPVIAGGWTAMKEVTGSGVLVPKSDSVPWWSNFGYQHLPTVGGIVDAMEYAYRNFGSADRALTRGFAMQYDVDHVLEQHMLPALEAAQAAIAEDAQMERACA